MSEKEFEYEHFLKSDGVGSFNGVCMCMSVCVEGCGVVRGVQAFSSRITCKNGGVGYLFFSFLHFAVLFTHSMPCTS